MIYRNTPLQCGKSPMELLQGRQARSDLPMSYAAKVKSGLVKPQAEKMRPGLKCAIQQPGPGPRCVNQQMRPGTKNATKPTHDLPVGQNVMYQTPPDKLWYPAKITARLDQPRSYEITTPDGTKYRRTQHHLKPYKRQGRQRINVDRNPEPPHVRPQRNVRAPDKLDL